MFRVDQKGLFNLNLKHKNEIHKLRNLIKNKHFPLS